MWHVSVWLPIGLAMLVSLPLNWSLTKATDAHFLKAELNLSAIFALPANILASVMVGVYQDMQWALFCFMVSIAFIGGVLMWVPLVLSWRKQREEKKSSSTASVVEASANASRSQLGASADVRGAVNDSFSNYPAVRKFVLKNRAVESVDAYLLHYQEEELSAYWSFWRDVIAYKDIDNADYRGGKAYLLYQKYLGHDAIVLLPGLSSVMKESIGKVILGGVEAVEKSEDGHSVMSAAVFDGAQSAVESILATMFLSYVKSEFYHDFKQQNSTIDLVSSSPDPEEA